MTTTDLSILARDYKRRVPGKFMLVDGGKLEEKIGGEEFVATLKLDGVMQLVRYADGEIRACGAGGNETPATLPCLLEAMSMLSGKGITSALFAAELYAVVSDTGRERVCDVAASLADTSRHGDLRLAPFDILEINGEDISAVTISEKLPRLTSLFGAGSLVGSVRSWKCHSISEVRQLYDSQVADGGAEGLVLHSSNGFVYKLKPRHTIDVAVIGFTEGEGGHAGMVRDMLTAVIRPDGELRQVVSVGGGLTDEQRLDLYKRLKDNLAESYYVETDSRGVAFQMVNPEIVIEISAVDFVTENSAGEPKINMLLTYDQATGYNVVGKTAGVALHSATFVRERTDKTACAENVRESQLTDLVVFSEGRITDFSSLPASEILLRRVFTKTTAGKTSVQKFVVWKTNKEQTGSFPAYVLHHTDYNFHRQEQLKRDIRVSDSRSQIFELCDALIASGIKKGWNEIV